MLNINMHERHFCLMMGLIGNYENQLRFLDPEKTLTDEEVFWSKVYHYLKEKEEEGKCVHYKISDLFNRFLLLDKGYPDIKDYGYTIVYEYENSNNVIVDTEV